MTSPRRQVVIERPEVCDHESLVAGAWCSPCQAIPQQEATAAAQTAAFNDNAKVAEGTVDYAAAAESTDVRWEGELGQVDLLTGDGRFIVGGALRFENLPMPFRYAREDVGGHDGAVVVGLIETLEERDGAIWGTGFIDLSIPEASEVYAGLQKGWVGGVSMDLDDVSFEVRVKKELLATLEAEIEDENEDSEPEESEDGYVTVQKGTSKDQVVYVTDARIRSATLVAIPAFIGGKIKLSEASGPSVDRNSLVAAGIPVNPPAKWFVPQHFDGPTPLTITDDGEVYGHGALWNTCHIGFQGTCTTPPYSATDYSWFHTGVIRTAEGDDFAVGKITLDTGHAAQNLTAAPAAAHYDHTGAVVADVIAYEDEHGIALRGALRPGLSAERIREFRAAPLSGDWREVGGNLELVAMLAVNTPGFGVPRTRALVASGRTVSLQVPSPLETEVSESTATPEVKFAKARAVANEIAKLRRREMLAAIQREG